MERINRRSFHKIRQNIKEFNEIATEGRKYIKRRLVKASPTIFFDNDYLEIPKLRWAGVNWCKINSDFSKSLESYQNIIPIITHDNRDQKELLKDNEYLNKSKANILIQLKLLAQIYLAMNLQILSRYSIEKQIRLRIKISYIANKLRIDDYELLSKPELINHIKKELRGTISKYGIQNRIPIKKLSSDALAREVLVLRLHPDLSVQDICERCNISKRKYYDICRKDKYGFDFEGGQIGRPLNEYSLSQIETDRIKKLLDTSTKSYNVPEICVDLKKTYNHSVSKDMVYYYIKKKLGYSYKRNHCKIEDTFTYEQLISNYKTATKLIEYFYQGRNIICLDETGFNIGIQRNYSYAKKGKHPFRAFARTPETRNVIMAITTKNIFAYSIRTKGHNEHSFIAFMIDIVNKILLMGTEYVKNTVIFLDNAPFHRSELAMKFLEMIPIEICFNAKAMSDFNPIETIFGIMKNRFRSKRYSTM